MPLGGMVGDGFGAFEIISGTGAADGGAIKSTKAI